MTSFKVQLNCGTCAIGSYEVEMKLLEGDLFIIQTLLITFHRPCFSISSFETVD